MKAKQILLYLIIMVLASCKPEEQPPVISYVFSDVSVDAKQTSATITCRNESVDDDKVFANVLLSRDENITDATKYPLHLQHDTLRGNITGLERNTMYYFCFEVYTANEHKRTNEVHHFETTSGGANVTVMTIHAINITQTSATSGGNVSAEGNTAINARGVCWDTVPDPNILQSPHLVSGEGTGGFVLNITGLMPGTTYYIRAYAMSNNMVYYGNEVSFSTTADKPTVTTSEVSNITQTTAQGGGNVTNDGGANVTERGICWSTSQNPTVSGSHAAASSGGTGSFTVSMTGLTANTHYYVRAYAKNSAGVTYGNEVNFTTSQNISAPTVTTSQVTDITQTTATGGGNVTSDGGASVTERGICWSTSHNPTTSSSHSSNGTGTGNYTCNMTGLTPNTTYYVRAYAKNSVGTAYGNEVSFTTTQNVTVPTVTTNTVTNITQTTATCGGNVTNSGNATVTARGICWSTSQNPTVSGNHTTDGTGTGSFTSNITGLTPNTTYYVRAYATNSQGTAYGTQRTFTTTQSISTPTVTTAQVTNITQTTATGGGNVTNSGNATVTARGVCWSTSQNPTVSGSHTTDGTGTGSFTSSITGLAPNTTYYVRAYATNSQGTAYGTQRSFTTTQSISIPTVTTAQVTNIQQTSATGGGNVTSAGGGTVTARGVCWSTSHNPTTSSSHTTNGSGTGSFTSSLTNLTPNTTYYVRAYATNSAGTAYGTEVSFITLSSGGGNAPTGAINGLFSVSAAQQVYFSQGNLQYQYSTNKWRFATNQYDCIGNDNSNISQTYSGWIDLFGWGTSRWNSGNTYYRPWDTDNSSGSLYGPPGQYNLTGSYANADWGVYNRISNGGNQSNQWRTLTQLEWNYVFNTRTTTSGIRYAKANVNNVNGVILLPDNWSSSTYSLSNINNSSASFSSNTLTALQWRTLEQAGAVFLPAAGSRFGTSVSYVGSYGYYWSASYNGSYGAYLVYFDGSSLLTDKNFSRCSGSSVRLVHDAQ